MQTSIIKKNNLERTLRIDGEYYQKKYLNIEKKIFSSSNVKAITDLCVVSDGNHMSIAKYFISEQGIPYYRGQDLTEFFLENTSPIFIPENIYNSKPMKRSHFKTGDVLISIVGTVGNLSLVTENIKKSTGSCKIAILRPKNIYPEYLAVFLMSKYGNEQIKRNTRGTVQTGIILEDFSQIYISVLSNIFQQKIVDIIKLSLSKNKKSKELYSQANRLLLSELNLLNWKPKHQSSFAKNYSDTISSSRIDAEYYQPMYDEIVNRFNKYKCVNLNDICELIGHPSNPPYAQNEETNKTFIVTQKHLGRYFLNNDFWLKDDALYTTKEFIKNNRQYLLRNNDILIYSVGAYIGKSNIYTANLKATIGSFLTIARLKENTINPYYLLLLLNTDLGIIMSKRYQRGLAQPYLYPYDIKKYIIPIIEDKIQKDIEKIMVQAKTKIDMSKNLLEIAKRGVEMAIEQDESTAENWMKSEIDKLGIDINI
jgi:restriction endonuclease S subunit